MSNLKKGLIVVTSGLTALLLSTVAASASPIGASTLSKIRGDFASTLAAAGLPFNAAAFDTDIASGAHSLGNLFGSAISSLARTIPPGPEHGKLISSFARANNPSNFNGSHGQSAESHGGGQGHRR